MNYKNMTIPELIAIARLDAATELEQALLSALVIYEEEISEWNAIIDAAREGAPDA